MAGLFASVLLEVAGLIPSRRQWGILPEGLPGFGGLGVGTALLRLWLFSGLLCFLPLLPWSSGRDQKAV